MGFSENGVGALKQYTSRRHLRDQLLKPIHDDELNTQLRIFNIGA
ncbi:uncharacterized protein RSE6_02860 [Rhynchosporium secalis]|uniref:Uncharacterized protein n=1 Tax=Rhynchosporium secalis TaxID=38038 RepID=A0A1E1M1B5_RHYSE|nr:uncharacterized protein RSE6_02860 [Rhynchosporium secalis]